MSLGVEHDAPRGALIDELVDRVAHRVAAIVLAEVRGAQSMVDQHGSDLGPRRHCAAVRRRIAKREPGATIQGRRHLLSLEAYEEELARSLRSLAKAAAGEADAANDDAEQAAYERTMRRYGGAR